MTVEMFIFMDTIRGFLIEAAICSFFFADGDSRVPLCRAGIEVSTGNVMFFHGDHTALEDHGTLEEEKGRVSESDRD